MIFEIPYQDGDGGLHRQVRTDLVNRIRLSERETTNAHDRYRDNENRWRLDRQKTQRDRKAAAAKRQGKDEYESIRIGYDLSLMDAEHTYYTNVFLAKPAIFQLTGTNAAGEDKILAMESELQYQASAGRMVPGLMTWLLDPIRYGIGVIFPYWERDVVTRITKTRTPIVQDGISTGDFDEEEIRTESVKYEGNKLINVLPYDFLPDPRVPLSDIQSGEFVGRRYSMSWLDAVAGEQNNELFNINAIRDHLSKIARKNRATSVGRNSSRSVEQKATFVRGRLTVNYFDCVDIEVRLIPADWGLGDSEYPELWRFTVAEEKVIIYAEAIDSFHGMFSCCVLEREVDGYGADSRGLFEVTKGLSDTMDWLINSHMFNKRASLNNIFVYDPSKVVSKDLQNMSRPGARIRLKPTALGTDIRTAVQQLNVADVTQSNYQDAGFIQQMMDRVSGTNADVAGAASGSSRRSATEFRGTTSFSTNRLAKTSMFFSTTGWADLAKILVANTQQYLSAERKVRVAGDIIKGADQITVDPQAIQGEYDFIPVDGTQPIDRFGQAQFLLQLLQQMITIPQIGQGYRIADLFAYIARLMGVKNIERFQINVPQNQEELIQLIRRLRSEAGLPEEQPNDAGTGAVETANQQSSPTAVGAGGFDIQSLVQQLGGGVPPTGQG